jgi:hypothetical protein
MLVGILLEMLQVHLMKHFDLYLWLGLTVLTFVLVPSYLILSLPKGLSADSTMSSVAAADLIWARLTFVWVFGTIVLLAHSLAVWYRKKHPAASPEEHQNWITQIEEEKRQRLKE